MSWTRRSFLASGAAAGLLGPRLAHARSGDKPNILLVFPDQLRAQSLSIYGERNIQTQVFDNLLSDSVHFPNAYSPDPVCAPARAGLLTGRMPHATGVIRNGNALPEDMPTIASVLRKEGYKTGYIGKWHLHDGKGHPGFVPPSRRNGFDDFRGYNVSHRYRHAIYYVGNKDKPVTPEPKDRWEPEFQVDLAADFMEKTKGPWFLMVAFGPPHPPGTAPIEDWSRDLPPGALDAVDPGRLVLPDNVPDFLRDANRGPDGRGPHDLGVRHHLQGYYASILALEGSVRRLLRAVDDHAGAENTVVVLSSDHGEMGGAHGLYQKGEPYEESVRVPLAFRWPGTLKPKQVDALASTVDLFPTLLGLAGVEIAGNPHDGANLNGWLDRDEGVDRDDILIQGKLGRPDTWRMLRSRRYTFVDWPNLGRQALWDMVEDPLQQRDLGKDREATDIRTALAERLGAERARVDDRSAKVTRRKVREDDED